MVISWQPEEDRSGYKAEAANNEMKIETVILRKFCLKRLS